jgi:hypothetical protein
MATGNTWRNDVLRLYFLGASVPNVADNAASAPFTAHTIALHTADPGSGGPQTVGETAYGGYARKTVPRNTAGWVVTGNSVSPAVDIDFDLCTGSPGAPITHWSISRGGGIVDYSGPLVTPVTMEAGKIPRVKTTSTIQLL